MVVGLAAVQGDAAVKTYRIVTDVSVPEGIADEEMVKLGQDSATAMRWWLRHQHGSSLELEIQHYGIKRLADAAPVARPVQGLGPGPGQDR